ncbi:hypothetical protein ACFVMC_24350 [Nocardia sp. NPDC127579]|uniref:hypothetical protein n=1 Tax=Nocardia sp. NPDC127579 TaxID=3345402 RepID=UPI00363D1782
MSDFDELYALTEEINQSWRRSVHEIRRTQGVSTSAVLIHQEIKDSFSGTPYGSVTVDSDGTLVSITLDPDQALDIYEEHLLTAVVTAINAAFDRSRESTPTAQGFR